MRFQNWPERLHALLVESQNKPFTWGEHDCCAFAAKAVLEITGVDHFSAFSGTYSTAIEAARVLRKNGGIRGIATSAMGSPIPAQTASRGDVVLVNTPDYGDTLAVCIGDRCAAPGNHTICYMPMSSAHVAWRVA